MLFALGVFGALLTAKQYERYTHHMERARQYRNALEKSVPGSNLEELKQSGDAIAAKAHPRLSKLKLVNFWVLLHLLSSALALVLFLIGQYGLLKCSP